MGVMTEENRKRTTRRVYANVYDRAYLAAKRRVRHKAYIFMCKQLYPPFLGDPILDSIRKSLGISG